MPRQLQGDAGQGAIFPSEPLTMTPVGMVPLSLIESFPDGLAPSSEFVENVRLLGVLQPVLLAPRGVGEQHRVVAGRRRVMAARACGMDQVPAIVVRGNPPASELNAARVSENQHRSANPLMEATAVSEMIGSGATINDVAQRLGIPAATVRRRAHLMGAHPLIRDMLQRGRVSVTVAEKVALLSQSAQVSLAARAERTDSGRLTRALYNQFRRELASAELGGQTEIPGAGPTREALGAPGISERGTDILGREFIVVRGRRYIFEGDIPVIPQEGGQALSLSVEALEGLETWSAVRVLLEGAQRSLPVEADDSVDDMMEMLSDALRRVDSILGGGGPAGRSVR